LSSVSGHAGDREGTCDPAVDPRGRVKSTRHVNPLLNCPHHLLVRAGQLFVKVLLVKVLLSA
jgi:hypothetical protein